MARRQTRLRRGRIGRGLLFSIFLHAQVLVPLVVWVFWWGKTDDNQVDVSFESIKDEELPPNLPAIEKPERNKQAKPATKPAHAIEKAPAAKPTKPEATTERPRELPPPEPATPKPEQKPFALPEELPRQKIVDLDMGKEVEAPKDAKYLAQRNNRTDHETRARQTNLERNQAGKASEPSDDRDKIAQLEDREAKPGQPGQQATAPEPKSPPEPRSALSMRVPGLEKVHGEPLPEDPDGMFSKTQEEVAVDGRRASDARRMSSVAEAPHLTKEGYESTFGDDSERAAAVAKQEKSKHKGKFTERNEQVFSALENFINEVTPSNQTELNTRAAPFAQFITHMHRQIHEKWAFGFLAQMDASFRNSPMNDLNLVAKLEIVLDGEGNVDKIAMVRTSGITGFDGAAISAVFAAAPFPMPPPAILSGNGKVYIHWKFHRNGDACGTPGVNYFILDNGDKSGSKPPATHSKHASASPTQG